MSSDINVMRLKAIDLLVHRDRFQSESLLAIVFRDATKASDRFARIADARVQIAQHVERCEIIRINGDDLTVFFYRSRDLSHFEKFFGCTESLCLIKSHLRPEGR